jgi:hypothetical protein
MRHRAFRIGRVVRAAGISLLVLLPALLAACGKSGGGSGY